MAPSFISPLLRPIPLFSIAAILRLALLFYGIWQDAHSAVKYTDIDYLVFTDAARYVSQGLSPYHRETYRYTPLLAWMLVPTATPELFSFGKVVFALADLLAGWLIVRVLTKQRGMSAERAGAFAAIWLWNPMVATISTRGSSEGLLGVLTMALLWAVEGKRIGFAGFILGLSVHFKIYPFIYAPAIIWWMDDEHLGKGSKPSTSFTDTIIRFLSPQRIQLTIISLLTFMGLNVLMYYMYVSYIYQPPLQTNISSFANLVSQLWNPFSCPFLLPPRHPYRPPPQLLALQHLPLSCICRSILQLSPRISPSIAPLMLPNPLCPRQERSRHLHDGPNLCLCHIQQGLHLTGMCDAP